MDSEDYFNWRENMERRQCESKRQICNVRKAKASNAWHGGEVAYRDNPRGMSWPSAAPLVADWPAHWLIQQPVGDLVSRGPPDSVSRQLDDMLFIPFSPDIINYEPSRGQLMTLDIGNDAILCKDLSKAFVEQYLCLARHNQNISILQNIKMQENESLREFMKRFGPGRAPSGILQHGRRPAASFRFEDSVRVAA
ncbi:hypothetical protein CK203_110054 [Vitis vinifera]|uniref:Retrotransposon gag domain-containing protein n=1 Tax=Vitis vinifera TaxID=29760 RepID=A0A438EA10_VITVI|nr:hypothetical protein CK203_110054 [Vitis vinifera]